MYFWASLVLCALAILLAIPATIFMLEIIAALVLPRKEPSGPARTSRGSVVVLIPAHNESAGILDTLGDANSELRTQDRILVVADNCSDDTATIAAAAGAEVIERHDLTNIGKGYALEFGLKHLRLNPPAVVIVIDADCRITAGTIDRLTRLCETTRRPVQALDLMVAPGGSPLNYRVAEFAWRVKNWARPLGLDALKLPCNLMGTGMAFPWEVISSTNISGASIVEDLRLGLELARLRKPALFYASARVTSRFPSSAEAAASQRKRWEAGHISTILSLPQLLYTAVAERNWQLLALALDMSVPPLSMFVLLLTGTSLLAALLAMLMSPLPLMIVGTTVIEFALGVFLAWINYGRDVLPLRSVLLIPSYVLAKVPLYLRILHGRDHLEWKRTDRETVRKVEQ